MLDQATIQFLEDRSLDPELADRCGFSTANIVGIKPGQSVLSFGYWENGQLVNEKFRLLPKEKFWQHKGRREIFWNADALNDPGLESGHQALVICEGELDALAAIQCGFPLSVSVPNGAPPARDGDSGDQDGRLKFLWADREKIAKVKRFVIAVDNDAPGEQLREMLIRHLGAWRCSFVEYTFGCKDLNDVLMKRGSEAVSATINGAKPCPYKGLNRFSDYPEQGSLVTFSSGFEYLDNHFKPFLGEFVIVTGIPQHGKSSWTLHLLRNLSRLHGFRSAIFSPEMRVVPVIRDRLLSIDGNCLPENAGPERNAWLEDSFVFIGSDEDDGDFNLEWIIQQATVAVLRDGIRVLLIDPWNEIEHSRERGESLTEYVARGIRMLKRFAQRYNVVVIVVAHPTKMPRLKDGQFEVPTLYDIADSAAWYNKCDHGIVVYRRFDPPLTEICVVKSRFEEAGETGTVKMRLDRISRRFEPLQPT